MNFFYSISKSYFLDYSVSVGYNLLSAIVERLFEKLKKKVKIFLYKVLALLIKLGMK